MRRIALVLLLATSFARADEHHDRLAAGEILVTAEDVPGSDVPRIRMEGVVDAPPAKVWDVVQHCGRYHGVLPRIAASEELSRAGNVVRCRTEVEVPWPMTNLTSITRAQHTESPALYRREWTLESGDYEFNEGSWTLTPFDATGGRTLVVYLVRTKPKSSVPSFVREMAQKKALPDVLEAIRRATKG